MNTLDKQGRTALLDAVIQTDLKSLKRFFVKQAIKREAEVNLQDKNGRTALHEALDAYSREVDCIRILINAGTDVNIQDKNGQTALDIEAGKGTVRFLMEVEKWAEKR